jgi:hypothetical protein
MGRKKRPSRAAYAKDRRAEKRANGECYSCLNPARPGRRECGACSARRCKQQRRYAQANMVSGACYCGRERAEGKSKCPACLESTRRAMERYREKRRAAQP